MGWRRAMLRTVPPGYKLIVHTSLYFHEMAFWGMGNEEWGETLLCFVLLGLGAIDVCMYVCMCTVWTIRISEQR